MFSQPVTLAGHHECVDIANCGEREGCEGHLYHGQLSDWYVTEEHEEHVQCGDPVE
jgi:hypothetical protein